MAWPMLIAAVVALGCCIAARPVVPWQGRQLTVVMTLAMTASLLWDSSPGPRLAVGAILLLSGMLGTAGLRGRPEAGACCHRALGSLVMAVCVLRMITPGEATSVSPHDHSLGGVVGLIAIAGVIALIAWTLGDLISRGQQAPTLWVIESCAMTSGVVMMWMTP